MFTGIYGFIFCDPKVINSSAIKNITRSGTTFTATRLNNGTFTFTQQDNNTTYANYKGATTAAAGTAGLVPAATTATRLNFLRGDGSWQTPTNTTYANYKGATTAASGTAGLVPAATTATRLGFLRGDGTWAVLINNTTYTNAGAALDARVGKALYDKIKNFMNTIYVSTVKKSGSISAGNFITEYYSYTPPEGYSITASIGTTMGYAGVICTHSWFNNTDKMGANISNVTDTTITFTESKPLTIQWAIIIKRTL